MQMDDKGGVRRIKKKAKKREIKTNIKKGRKKHIYRKTKGYMAF